MANYYVNKHAQPNGDHEVHVPGCSRMPLESNRIYLGNFESCVPAVKAAKNYYLQSNVCFHCSKACNTG